MIKSVCGYCGVGCGLEFDEKSLIGEVSYPVNEGLVCAKGVSELKSIDTSTRLLRPLMRQSIENSFKESSWEESIKRVADAIKNTSASKVGFYLSGQLLTEDYYVANKLAKGFIGTNSVDTNSRTCMASAVVAHKKVFGVDFVPVKISDIKECELLILIGANTAEAHVVLNNKIKKAKKNGLKVVVIDPRFTPTAKLADLYLPIHVGADIDLINLLINRLINEDRVDLEFIENYTNGYEILKNKFKRLALKKMLKRTGLSTEQFEQFYQLFIENDRVITAWTMGLNQSVQGVDKNIAVLNLHLVTGKIYRAGCGPFSLTGQPNAMGGREVGGLSTTLAVHLDFDKESIKKVSSFWNTDKIAPTAGHTATQMLKEDIDVLIISHTDPLYHLPNRHLVEKQLQRVPLIIEINAYKDSETSKYAHIRLPAAPWGEKEGTQTNLDRTITKQEKLTRTSIDCKADWKIFQLIAQELGFKEEFNFSSPKEIFSEYKEMTRLSPDGHLNIYDCDYDELSKRPFSWGDKIVEDKKFFTKNAKANIVFVENKLKSEKTSLAYPLILLTGRTRDRWHSETKTIFVDLLQTYKPSSFVEINSLDAKKYGIYNGDSVVISSKRGSLTTKAIVSDEINRGAIFIPITDRNINYLTSDILDPLSHEPDYNHSAVKIEKKHSE
ncbi:MAG: molybdopterin oxidoreductase family protein [Campylobacterota bacterium]|nr:molybdopterin oxidoreductase family protein [Campylobacterota bacterium]